MLKSAPKTVDYDEFFPLDVRPQELLNASYGAAQLLDGVQTAFFSKPFIFDPDTAKEHVQWVSDAHAAIDGALSTAFFVLTLTARFLDDLTVANISYTRTTGAPPCPAALQ